jgi:hypothetical protein
MTTREMQGHLEEIYGIEVSPTLTSNGTDALIEDADQGTYTYKASRCRSSRKSKASPKNTIYSWLPKDATAPVSNLEIGKLKREN